jgi:predicted phosphodiesterase
MLAVVYDVHGNLPALDAVLADAAAAGADAFLLGGDYCALGAWPLEVLARLDALPNARWIRGNHERWLAADRSDMPANPVLTGALAHERAVLPAARIAALGALPETAAGDGVLFCHASPESDMAGFETEPRDGEAALLLGTAAPRVVVGHTHLQFRREIGGAEVVNPGSAGLPLDGDRRAAYALIAPDGGLELRRVDYDVELAMAALRELGEVWSRTMAGWLERARPAAGRAKRPPGHC